MNSSFSGEAARLEVWCCECKYNLSVSQSAKNRVITRPRKSHLPSVWYSRMSCSFPTAAQKD